jgi:hypothetical protein
MEGDLIMECPYCQSELVYNDYYFSGNYSAGEYEKLGDIYQCGNSEFFEDVELAKIYVSTNNLKLGIGDGFDFTSLEEVCCESGIFNGHFYTDKNEELHEGYPC